MEPFDWLNKSYSCYMTAIVVIIGRCGLSIMHAIETNPIRVI